MKADRFFGIALPLLCAALLCACGQDPIFYTIAQEVAPLDPRIEGAPTNMVVIDRDYPGISTPVPVLYVASSRLHWYARPLDHYKTPGASMPPRWDSSEHAIPQPGGKIVSLAATSGNLYALCLSGSGVAATLKRFNETAKKWDSIPINDSDSDAAAYPLLQNIYADPEKGQLFAGSRKNPPERSSGYAILYVASDDTLYCLQKETELLSGVVYQGSDYFLSTRGKGLYSVPETFFNSISPSGTIAPLVDDSGSPADRNFMGIIKLHTKIVAVDRGGTLFEVTLTTPAQFKPLVNSSGSASFTLGTYAQGSLALWQEPTDTSKKLLLAGISSLSTSTSTGYTYGYVEFELLDNGAFDLDGTRHEAGAGTLYSTPNNDRYTATIGKHPVNFIFQAPEEIDDNMTLFASTQRAGLWSYRNRKDGWQWNAEE